MLSKLQEPALCAAQRLRLPLSVTSPRKRAGRKFAKEIDRHKRSAEARGARLDNGGSLSGERVPIACSAIRRILSRPVVTRRDGDAVW